MDYQVIWSPEALGDVEAIAEYVGRDSRFYARAVVQQLLEGAASLKEFPNAGRVAPEFGDGGIRECFIHSYRMIYQIPITA
jgi:toxin ParE1/3/4